MRKILISLLFLPLACFAHPNSVVYNVTNDTVVHGSLFCEEVSIASISKLMTVYTVLQYNQSMDEKLTVTGNKVTNTKLRKGMILTRQELINLALVSSDNLAAITLAENFPGGMNHFIYNMNNNSKTLGMHQTGFVEPTGLSPMNHSTVGDIIKLTKAVSEYTIVQHAAQTQRVVSPVELAKNNKTKKKRKAVKEPKKPKSQVVAGNPTSRYFGHEGLITIKTGFTNAAGFCITMLLYANNQLYNITVLGARTKQEREKLVKQSLAKIYNT